MGIKNRTNIFEIVNLLIMPFYLMSDLFLYSFLITKSKLITVLWLGNT